MPVRLFATLILLYVQVDLLSQKIILDSTIRISSYDCLLYTSMFGFLGLIFGPLLVSYVILLIRIYTNEFLENKDLSTTEKAQ